MQISGQDSTGKPREVLTDTTGRLVVAGTITATVDTSLLATAAKQDTAAASLASIDGKLPTALGPTTPALSLSVAPAMSATLTTGQKSVTTTVGALAASGGPFKNGIKLTNLSTSASPLFYGPSGVSATTGDELPAGQSVVLTMTDPTAVYVITASGTATASYAGLA